MFALDPCVWGYICSFMYLHHCLIDIWTILFGLNSPCYWTGQKWVWRDVWTWTAWRKRRLIRSWRSSPRLESLPRRSDVGDFHSLSSWCSQNKWNFSSGFPAVMTSVLRMKWSLGFVLTLLLLACLPHILLMFMHFSLVHRYLYTAYRFCNLFFHNSRI